MKKLLLSVLCICFLAPSQAFSEAYITPKLAGSFVSTPEVFTNIENSGIITKDSLNAKTGDTLFSIALAIGYDFNSTYNIPVRTELEYSFFSQFNSTIITSFGEGYVKIDIQTVLINAYYDFHNASKFTPYVGAGLGLAFLGHGDKTKSNFAWNLGIGSAYAFTDTISFDLAYRYAQFGKAETEKFAISATKNIWDSTDTISAHQIMLGVRCTF